MYYSCILVYLDINVLFRKVPRENVLYRVCEGAVCIACEKKLSAGKENG